MDWEYNIINDRNLLVTRASGKFSVASIKKMVKSILSDTRWSPGMDCLIDHSSLDHSETRDVDIEALAEIHKRYDVSIGLGRIAIVLGSEKNFALGQLYGTLVERHVIATVKSFHTADEARQWLAS